MRIVIDMQGAQSTGSWNRGIGRYTMSLASAIVSNRGSHEVILVLNGAFPDSIARVRAHFVSLLQPECIRIWNSPRSTARKDAANYWRCQASELIREAFLVSLKPDIVLVSSLFEGLVDDAVTSIKHFSTDIIYVVILYDLIPLIHSKSYLNNPLVKGWYFEKAQYLRRADLWLAISESSRQEGCHHLDLPSERCINISSDADSCFKKITISPDAQKSLRIKYGLTRKFVMYTGGIDHRKNIEGLIRAFARLETQLRTNHQLAIVCSVQPESRRLLVKLAMEQGLGADELILTGFVPEQDLISLYNLCALFVFPSLHEGFGLPALEAMRCGAPVIAANTSSLPEVVDLSEAVFDPYSDFAIANAMERALADAAFREHLISHGTQQAARFSWNESARRSISAMERKYAERDAEQKLNISDLTRPLLAYLSPLPPERSGISDYSAALLPALSKYYEIEVVVAQANVTDPWIMANCPIRTLEWFVANADRFDRVLYHFGNSTFHEHMFGLLKVVPGVVVLHDFFLSGILHHIDMHGYAFGYFNRSIYRSHGYLGLVDKAQCKDATEVVLKYPCSREVIEDGLGTVVHSDHALKLAEKWYGLDEHSLTVIPLLRAPVLQFDKPEARIALGLSPTDFVVCSFGIIAPTKLNHRLLQAWQSSDLAEASSCRLMFVGECLPGDYGSQLLSSITRHPGGSRVCITGWLEQEVYRLYLAAADLTIQLRSLTRGETSAAVLDCMNYGHPTIVNANGSMADLANDNVLMLPDDFTDQDLIEALEALWRDCEKRQQLGTNALNEIRTTHDPLRCAERYMNAVEHFYSTRRFMPKTLIPSIAALSSEEPSDDDLLSIAQAIALTFPPPQAQMQLLVDVSGLINNQVVTGIAQDVRYILREWLLNPPVGWRIEPVYATLDQSYRYARKFTTTFLDVQNEGLNDDPIDFASGDIFFAMDLRPEFQSNYADYYQYLRCRGLKVKFFIHDLLLVEHYYHCPPPLADSFANWLEVVVKDYGAICISRKVADGLLDWIKGRKSIQSHTLMIEYIDLASDDTSVAVELDLSSCSKRLLTMLLQCEESFPFRTSTKPVPFSS